MTRIDFHIHTRNYSDCSKVNARELVLLAEKKGIDVLILTEHDKFWDKKELAELNSLSKKVTVLNGVEISCSLCHILVFGLDAEFPFFPQYTPERLFSKLSEYQDIAVIPAHPFRYGPTVGNILRSFPFDALEGFSLNTSCDASTAAERFAKERNVPLLAASDLHEIGWFGAYWSETEESVKSMNDFVRVIKDKKLRTPDFIEAEIHLNITGV